VSLDNTIFNRVLRICLLMLHRGLTGADSRVLTESGYVWSSEGHVNVSEQLVVSGNKINLQFCIFVDITDWIKLGCCCHRSYGSGRKGPDGALIHTRATAQRGGKRLGEALIHTTTSAILSGGRSVGPTHDHATTKIAVICCCYKPEVSRPGSITLYYHKAAPPYPLSEPRPRTGAVVSSGRQCHWNLAGENDRRLLRALHLRNGYFFSYTIYHYQPNTIKVAITSTLRPRFPFSRVVEKESSVSCAIGRRLFGALCLSTMRFRLFSSGAAVLPLAVDELPGGTPLNLCAVSRSMDLFQITSVELSKQPLYL